MPQFKHSGDDRNRGFCVYCGGPNESRDHTPSRVFLDDPLPPNTPVVPACIKCNSSFSSDEEYLACFIECALTGSIERASKRPKIGKIFRHSPKLQQQIASSSRQSGTELTWIPKIERVKPVLLKLAQGHMAFEQNEPQLDPPSHIGFVPIHSMTVDELSNFENPPDNNLWPEVGSRAMIRMVEHYGTDNYLWNISQPNNYRYRAISSMSGYKVQIVLREYLAAEVGWKEL